ncbi:hypothetical protein BGZ67_000871 [Mortierella alpina]|nr:hypothetical protein BGZ67_000871 [Mortierella alpina]
MKCFVILIGLISLVALAVAVPTPNDQSPEELNIVQSKNSSEVAAGFPTGVVIKSMDRKAPNMCVDNKDMIFAIGGQIWRINGDSTIELEYTPKGTNERYCLDFIHRPGELYFVVLNVCIATVTSQQWYFSAINNIVNKENGYCLDIRQHVYEPGTKLIVYQCEDGGKKANQLWALGSL